MSTTADFSLGIHKPMLFAALYNQARSVAEPNQLPQTQTVRRPNRWSETPLENEDDSYHRESFEDAEAAVNSPNNPARSDGTSVGVGKYYSWRDAMKCIADAPDREKIHALTAINRMFQPDVSDAPQIRNALLTEPEEEASFLTQVVEALANNAYPPVRAPAPQTVAQATVAQATVTEAQASEAQASQTVAQATVAQATVTPQTVAQATVAQATLTVAPATVAQATLTVAQATVAQATVTEAQASEAQASLTVATATTAQVVITEAQASETQVSHPVAPATPETTAPAVPTEAQASETQVSLESQDSQTAVPTAHTRGVPTPNIAVPTAQPMGVPTPTNSDAEICQHYTRHGQGLGTRRI
jgi:hypothetical protein